MKRFSLFLLLAFLFLSHYALAQTPDDMTPAEELVCEGLQGASYGLCNAYCEALDCDSDFGYEQHPNACNKVLGNYQKKTEVAGPPCDCDNICKDEKIECENACGDDEDCKDECCKTSKNCKTDCCGQDNDIRVARCIDNCEKGDGICIRECIEESRRCSVQACQKPTPK